MLWQVGTLLVLMPLFSSCAVKHLPPPAPIINIDIAALNKGDESPFNGIIFSPSYLEEYLQWKSQ